jgi:hypothetical protein
MRSHLFRTKVRNVMKATRTRESTEMMRMEKVENSRQSKYRRKKAQVAHMV